ncbi:hypothetical protein [Desulfocastanea catecholica]
MNSINHSINKKKLCLILTYYVMIISLLFVNDVFSEEPKLYVSFAYSKNIENFIITKGFTFIPVIYPRNIDANNDGKLDQEIFLNYIQSTLNNYDGPVVLDWEGEACNSLLNYSQSSEKYEQAILEFLKPIEIIKKTLTHEILIGYYGLPSKKNSLLHKTIEETKRLANIYEDIDIFYPSLYLNNDYLFADKSIEIIKKHLYNTLEIGCGNKNIYVFITHRWHPNSRFSPNKLVPLSIFEKYIKMISQTNYDGCHIDGLIWWGADEYWYNKGKKEIVVDLDRYPTMHEFNSIIIDNYANVILQYFPTKLMSIK